MKGQIVGPLQFGGMNLTCDGKQEESDEIYCAAISSQNCTSEYPKLIIYCRCFTNNNIINNIRKL